MMCNRCNKKAEKGWRFCPNCGSIIHARSKSLFDDIFSRFRGEFKEMDKAFEKEFEVLDLSPVFRQNHHLGNHRKVNRKGFTIKITRRNDQRPRVNVQTFGNIDRNAVRKEVSEEMKGLGMEESDIPRPAPRAEHAQGTHLKGNPHHKPARFTEEPNTKVRSLGNKVIVDMELPDVGSESDIEVKRLESSVEVRARAGDKAYFKIITKPEQFSVTSRSFEKGILHLEFS